MAAGYDPGITPPTRRDDRPDQHDRLERHCRSLGIFDNGLTYMNSTVSIADVTDGTSNTVLMGETLTGTWAEASSCCVRTTIDRTDQQADPDQRRATTTPTG